MGKYVLVPLIAALCSAQTGPPTPADLAAIQSALDKDLRGKESLAGGSAGNSTPAEMHTAGQRPAWGSVSVAQLRHKPPRKAQQALVRGLTLSNAGKRREASEEFAKAVAADPDFAYAHDRLGVEYALLGRRDEAEAHLRRSVALDAASSEGQYDLGVFLYQSGDLPGAEQSTRRALELSKMNAYAHLLMARVLFDQGRSETEVIEHLRYAARFLPEAADFLRFFGKE